MNDLDRLLRTSGVVVGQDIGASSGVRKVFLHAGHVFVSPEPAEVITILGSCVSICIWDPVTEIGGINHFMLAREVGANVSTARYANYATTALLDALSHAGADLRRSRAKIFGGARVLGVADGIAHDLGSENVYAARERLHAEKIAVVDQDTGGDHGRKLIYRTANGTTTVTAVARVET